METADPTTVILNGVSPWAQAGAKRSEELRHCRKAANGCIQNDGLFFSPVTHP